MPALRFIHTADIHLDSPLHGLSAYPNAPAAQLRGASRQAFEQLVSCAVEQKVDFMVIAGDLYDGDWPDFNTGLFFCHQMGRLQAAGIPVFLQLGNHDAESQMTRALRLPDNVRRFSAARPESCRLEHLKVVLHGQSFRQRDTTDNLASHYPPAQRGWFNIGVLHTALEGYAAHARYAPCSLSQLQAFGYDYWALGHVHEFQLWQDAATVCFPGNLQGRSIRETGRRGAVLVSVDAEGALPRVERLFFDVLRWEHLRVDLSPCQSFGDVGPLVAQCLQNLLADDAQVPRAVRISLQGRCALHGELFQRRSELRAHVLAELVSLAPERLWLEKVGLETQPPEVFESGAALDDDALTAMHSLLQEASQDPALLATLRDEFNQMLGKAPALAQESDLLRQAREGQLAALLSSLVPGLIARLNSAENA